MTSSPSLITRFSFRGLLHEVSCLFRMGPSRSICWASSVGLKLKAGGSRLKDGKTSQNIDCCRAQNLANALMCTSCCFEMFNIYCAAKKFKLF